MMLPVKEIQQFEKELFAVRCTNKHGVVTQRLTEKPELFRRETWSGLKKPVKESKRFTRELQK